MLLLILCIIVVCNQLVFKETDSISNFIPSFMYTDGDTFISSPEPKALGELIGWESSGHPSVCLSIRRSVGPHFQYL